MTGAVTTNLVYMRQAKVVSTFANGTVVPSALVESLSKQLGISPVYKDHGYRTSSSTLLISLTLIRSVTSYSQVPRDRCLARIRLLSHRDYYHVLGLEEVQEREEGDVGYLLRLHREVLRLRLWMDGVPMLACGVVCGFFLLLGPVASSFRYTLLVFLLTFSLPSGGSSSQFRRRPRLSFSSVTSSSSNVLPFLSDVQSYIAAQP